MRTEASRKEKMVKLDNWEKASFNYKGYPYINERNELEWWVTIEQYDGLINTLDPYDPHNFK